MTGVRTGGRRPILVDPHGYIAGARVAVTIFLVVFAFVAGFLTHWIGAGAS